MTKKGGSASQVVLTQDDVTVSVVSSTFALRTTARVDVDTAPGTFSVIVSDRLEALTGNQAGSPGRQLGSRLGVRRAHPRRGRRWCRGTAPAAHRLGKPRCTSSRPR